MTGYRRPNGAVEWWLEFALFLLVAVVAFLIGVWVG